MGIAKNTGLSLLPVPIRGYSILPEGAGCQHFSFCSQLHIAEAKFWKVQSRVESSLLPSSLHSWGRSSTLAAVTTGALLLLPCSEGRSSTSQVSSWDLSLLSSILPPCFILQILKQRCHSQGVTFPTLSFRGNHIFYPGIKSGRKTEQLKHFLKELALFAAEYRQIQA